MSPNPNLDNERRNSTHTPTQVIPPSPTDTDTPLLAHPTPVDTLSPFELMETSKSTSCTDLSNGPSSPHSNSPQQNELESRGNDRRISSASSLLPQDFLQHFILEPTFDAKKGREIEDSIDAIVVPRPEDESTVVPSTLWPQVGTSFPFLNKNVFLGFLQAHAVLLPYLLSILIKF